MLQLNLFNNQYIIFTFHFYFIFLSMISNLFQLNKATLFIFFFSLILFSCDNKTLNEIKIHKEVQGKDWSEIIHTGKITVLFESNSSSYFEYHGTSMGFEYELLKEFCKDHQLTLDVQIVSNQNDMFELLNNGQVDLIAANLSVTNDRKRIIAFSEPILNAEQVLVQRKKEENSLTEFITDPTQLAEKKVSVWGNSAYFLNLKNIQNEIGDTIFIHEENGEISPDYLIEQVADGTIDYTVTDKNIALINQFYWNNIDISLPISFKQKIAFGLRKSAVKLKSELDNWLVKFKSQELYAHLKYKYFELPSTANLALQSTNTSGYNTILKVIKSKAKKKGVDWQLVSAIVYKESRFNPTIVGLGGAYGLFQFMPQTGARYGVYPSSGVEEQVDGGIRLILGNYNLFKDVENHEERVKFALAAYNSGASHVHDARALARKHHLNPNKWTNNVEIMYRNLSNPEYYTDPIVKFGSSRGVQTVNYVSTVFNLYNKYKNTNK